MIKTNKFSLYPEYEVRFERGIYMAEVTYGAKIIYFLMEKRLEWEDEKYVRGVIDGIVGRC